MELADMQDLGSCAARREGSSPSFRILTSELWGFSFYTQTGQRPEGISAEPVKGCRSIR